MAKGFAFRLEPLLRLREMRESAQQRVVADHVRRVGQAQERVRSLGVQIVRQVAAVRSTLAGQRLPLEEVIAGRNWLGRLRRDFLVAQHELQQRQSELLAQRRQLAEAAKQKRVLEKLKERRRAEYDAQLSKLEDVMLDEIGVSAFVRSSGPDGGEAA